MKFISKDLALDYIRRNWNGESSVKIEKRLEYYHVFFEG